MTTLLILLVLIGACSLLVLFDIKENVRKGAAALEQVSETLARESTEEKGKVGGNFRRTANMVTLIYNLLNSETGYEEKRRTRREEMRKQSDEEYQNRYGERDRLNAEWAKQYDAGITRLEFLEWLKENHKDFKYPAIDSAS
jgi:uncharacterized protein (DUF3084 family)